jgi:tetratricopeptide (TPR) repeat protein
MLTLAQANPASFDDVVSKATAAREKNDIPRAIELYGQAVRLNPQWPDGWWFLGFVQYGTGDYAAARDALTHYIELNPNAGPALALRGLCEFETGEYPQSLKDIQRGLSFGAANQPRNEKILRYHEALLLTRTGRFEEALRSYALFAHDEAPAPELLLGTGLAGLRTPLLPQDVAAGRQDLFLAAGSASFRFMAGDVAGAQRAFQDLLQRFPKAPNAHYLYGYFLFASDPDQALAEFKRELEVAPSNAAAHVMLAWYSLMRNNSSEALPYAKLAVSEAPSMASAQLVLGRSLTETADLPSGIEHLEKALQLEPDNLEAHLALAKAYSKSGRKDDAQRERRQSLQLTQGGATQVARP